MEVPFVECARAGSSSHAGSFLGGSVFHDRWWLSAASNGEYREVTVESGGKTVGRLPFVLTKKKGFTHCRLPPFTHVLGPLADPGEGKAQTQLANRLEIVRKLIDQLPRFDYFTHALDTSLADGLAFQERGFEVKPQYTFVIDCNREEKALWDGMDHTARRLVRRAKEKFSVDEVDGPDEFVSFYLENLKGKELGNRYDFTRFPEIFRQARMHGSGKILRARWPNGKPAAMTFLVWGRGRMYYHLTTRACDASSDGPVNLLIWSAIQQARALGLIFDLDGVTSSGTARFLSGFGGVPKLRLIIMQSRSLFGALRYIKRQLFGRHVCENFT
jgi:Acetyltransferase (GNAT) domain